MRTERLIGIPEKEQEKLEAEYNRKEEEGIPTKEPQKEIKDVSGIKKGFDIAEWVSRVTSKEFRENSGILKVLKKASLETKFQDIWDYEIVIPEELTEKGLINRSLQIIEDLELLSVFKLNSGKIASSENISEVIDKIIREIEFLQRTSERPSEDMYNSSKHAFGINVSFYLKRKIMIEKLEEMLNCLRRYKLT